MDIFPEPLNIDFVSKRVLAYAFSGFSLALIIGILVGTYSPIYVVSTVALDLGVSRLDLATIDKKTGKAIEKA
jgi:preprotein translocase subunit SecF